MAKRILNPGYMRVVGRKRPVPVFVVVEYDGTRLSLTGVEGPLPNGNAVGSAGQIDLQIDDLGPEWSGQMVQRLRALWSRWHLNDMRPGCVHQMAAGWDKRRADPSKPANTYGVFGSSGSPTWNRAGWLRRDEHPEGLLDEPCPQCGHRYGSTWEMEPVPPEVIAELFALPETTIEPAWA